MYSVGGEMAGNVQPNTDGSKKPKRPRNRQRKGHNGEATSKTAWMTKDTGEVMHTIEPALIEPADTEVSSKSGFEVLCSYNWQSSGKIIFVPGGPPRWVPPILPVTLPQDSGHQYIDRNAFHVPKHPFEPAFQAMLNMSPDVRFDDIDIIVNRNSLRKLLDFASGKRQDPFRMDLNMVKDTLFISRRERKARQIIHGTPNAGYGHNLEKAFTKPDNELEDSGSHHRVIRYHLGHLNCVVRFEVDAYYDSTDEPNTESPSLATVDDITASVAQLTIKKQQPVPLGKASTQVIVKGTPIHSSKLAEIKARKTVKINECMPQLWFGRTPYLLTGLHTGGVFCSVNHSHIGPQFLDWEIANQERLRKLVSLLAEIRRVVGETKSGAAALVCEKKVQIFSF